MELKDLKVGDTVIIEPYIGEERLARVERLTDTMIILKHSRFYKAGGRLVGSGMRGTWLRIATEDKIKELIVKSKKRKIIEELKSKNWEYFSLEVLSKIQELLEEYKVNSTRLQS